MTLLANSEFLFTICILQTCFISVYNFKVAWVSLKFSKTGLYYIWPAQLLTLWERPLYMLPGWSCEAMLTRLCGHCIFVTVGRNHVAVPNPWLLISFPTSVSLCNKRFNSRSFTNLSIVGYLYTFTKLAQNLEPNDQGSNIFSR